ncbi:hypothetical protein BaRGS_00016862 [Batillaria attramentaria]|uniref:Uncharacterized protein n=1 Tax=Batillaria attramentaria TaxID=370345 RepID=A0ABD0KX36_9CAEN
MGKLNWGPEIRSSYTDTHQVNASDGWKKLGFGIRDWNGDLAWSGRPMSDGRREPVCVACLIGMIGWAESSGYEFDGDSLLRPALHCRTWGDCGESFFSGGKG